MKIVIKKISCKINVPKAANIKNFQKLSVGIDKIFG